LKPEQLTAARKLWREQGPADYTLSYTTRVDDETNESRYRVVVRGGKTVASTFNGNAEAPERLPFRGMEALFNDVERFQKKDIEKGSPKTYVRAIFDDQKTGGLRWYVRRVMGTHQRVEITVDQF